MARTAVMVNRTWNETISLDVSSLGKNTQLTYAYIDYENGGQSRARLKVWRGHYHVEEGFA